MRFVKSQNQLKNILQEQTEDAKDLEEEFKEEKYDETDQKYEQDEEDESDSDFETEEKSKPQTKTKSFKIEITSPGAADSNGKSAKQNTPVKSEEERMREMLDDEKLDKLLKLKLPEDVAEILGDPLLYDLPTEEKDAMQNLERDMRKMSEGLHDKSPIQRKYSKLAILKHYKMLMSVYQRYCKLGQDRHWLTMDGFLWMLRDAAIPDKNSTCTTQACKQLFNITYKMHHRLQSRHQSRHRIKISASYGDSIFHDSDPWTGIWKLDKTKSSGDDNRVYKLRKIGDSRICGCIDKDYANISGAFDALNSKKAELEIKYLQRRRVGVRRVWKAQLIAPKTITDDTGMKVQWTEIDKNARQSQLKTGKLHLIKVDKLNDNDADLPKDALIGLSQHEFLDLMLSVSTTKYGLDYQFQYICTDKLCTQHLDGYIYKNIISNQLNTMETNETVKQQMRSKNLILRKLFKMYACLDSDENAEIESNFHFSENELI